MKYLALLSVFVLSVLSSVAQARTLTCSGARLSYDFFQPDGGPAIGSSEHLFYGNETLIDISFPGQGVPTQLARFNVMGDTKTLSEKKDGYYITTVFQATGVITRLGEGGPRIEPFFLDVVCTEVSYVGPPIP